MLDMAHEIFENNFYGVIRVSQAIAPILRRNGGGAVINVLSDAAWFSGPFLSAYAASKSAAWSYPNALRLELRDQGTLVQGLHISFMDTDMTAGFDMAKISPRPGGAAFARRRRAQPRRSDRRRLHRFGQGQPWQHRARLHEPAGNRLSGCCAGR
jgi:NAD(P)-dependent dehydrogenase (short-subunit alcohol dehydrogenase family)